MSTSGIGNNNISQFEAFMRGGTQAPTAEPEKKPEVEVQKQEPEPEPQPEPQSKAEEPKKVETKPEEPKAQEPEPEPTPEPEPAKLEITDDAIVEYLRTQKGKEVSSLDELFNRPEPEPQPDPMEGLSDDVQAFLKYHKDTGRGFDDYMALNRDIDAISPLDIAREKAIAATGGVVDKKNIDAYLEKKLGIDLSDIENMDPLDLIELQVYGADYKKQMAEEREKYRQPIQKQTEPQQPAGEDYVTLEGGAVMKKADYELLQRQRQEYLDGLRKTADSITGSKFQVKVDDNGVEKVYDLGYDYSKEDKHKMVSSATDIYKALSDLFNTEQGTNFAGLQEAMFWADPANREKAINSIVHKARAEWTQEFMEISNNTGASTNRIPQSQGAKSAPLPGFQKPTGGIKWNLEHFKPPQN